MRYTADEDAEEPPHLRRLRRMVMALLVVLMLGIVTIAATIVIRLGFAPERGETAGPVMAEKFELPAGEIVSTGRGAGSVLFVLRSPDGAERLHVFDAGSGALLSTTELARE